MRRKLLVTIIFIVLLYSCNSPLKKNAPLTNQPTSNPDTISIPTKWLTATESSENQKNGKAEDMKINDGTKVDLMLESNSIIIKPKQKIEYKLSEMLFRINDENTHNEVDTGVSEGKEQW